MLQEGDKAPAFTAKDQDGNTVSLADFRGKKVVLFFYPEDNTPTCTVEACNLRDNFSLLKKKGFIVLGVSPDDMKSHKKFEQKYHLPYPLLADPEKKIVEAYGTWGPKKLFGHKYMGLLRTTFIIDENGKIERIFHKVHSKNHSQQILDTYSVN